VPNAFISHFQHTNNAFKVISCTTALLGFLKKLIPWRDTNPGLLVPETEAMSTAPRRQGLLSKYSTSIILFATKLQNTELLKNLRMPTFSF
jgi:hypothetical protein